MDLISIELIEFSTRFSIFLVATLIVLKAIYSRRVRGENVNAFLLFSSGVFLVTFWLHNVDMSMGFAFGLFAVFSMLRYRTETLSVRDMTFLFIVITLALLSSVGSLSLLGLVAANGLICIIAFLSEIKSAPISDRKEQQVIYDVIQNIKPENREILLSDLTDRTGLDIVDVDVLDIDLMRDVATLKIYYLEASS